MVVMRMHCCRWSNHYRIRLPFHALAVDDGIAIRPLNAEGHYCPVNDSLAGGN